MNTRWFAVYVRRRRDHAENMSAEQHRLLTDKRLVHLGFRKAFVRVVAGSNADGATNGSMNSRARIHCVALMLLPRDHRVRGLDAVRDLPPLPASP
jgi:hypothetical protein